MSLPSKVSADIANVAADIGIFYLQKNNNDYKKTEEEIKSLGIHLIEIDNVDYNSVHIYTSRPGLIIGKRGLNFYALEKHLEKRLLVHECADYTYLCTPIDLVEWEKSEGYGV